MIPNYVMPFIDTNVSYKEFLGSPVPEQLTERKRTELQDLMLHRIVGPGRTGGHRHGPGTHRVGEINRQATSERLPTVNLTVNWPAADPA